MRLKDIIITDDYAESKPSQDKVAACLKYYETYGKQDRYIVVNPRRELIDGYIMYLVLKAKCVEEAKVKISTKTNKKWNRIGNNSVPKYATMPTTYIYGVHPLDPEQKEYVWRVPNSWIGWADNLLPADMIMVNTSRGVKTITITKIAVMDKPPREGCIRKVFRKVEEEWEC